jgi:hypothetical protein
LSQAEVEDLGVVGAPACGPGDENVARLDVAVNNTCGVGRIQRIGDLDSDRQQEFCLGIGPVMSLKSLVWWDQGTGCAWMAS